MIIVRIIGGLGNQMFQYAFYKYLKEKYINVKCDIVGFERYKLHTGFDLEKVFNIQVDKASLFEIKLVTDFHKQDIFSKIIRKILGNKASHIKESNYYVEIIDSSNDYYLDGYWQSEKYFGNQEQLKLDFAFNQNYDKKDSKAVELICSCNSVSVHVRRGDYVGNKVYVHLDEAYYNNAMNVLQNQIKNPVYFIFSDDIIWAKESLIPRLQLKSDIVFIEKNSEIPYNDMRLMALCNHNIIANSSFSWWSAWLNKNNNKVVVAPMQWYTNPIMNTQHVEQLPISWMKI